MQVDEEGRSGDKVGPATVNMPSIRVRGQEVYSHLTEDFLFLCLAPLDIVPEVPYVASGPFIICLRERQLEFLVLSWF